MFLRLLTLCLLLTPAFGQQTIFNVPSADIATRKDWFFQHQTTTRAWNPGRSWVQTNAFGYGIAHFTEVDATLYNLDLREPENTAFSIGFKTIVPLRRSQSKVPLHLVVGDMLEFTEGESKAGRLRSPHEGNWSYAMLSTEMPRTKTRLSGGLTDGTKILFGERANGFLGGVEQPLSRRWSFQADWFSGHHALAYWIPGVVYRFQERWMLSLGVQFPNRPSAGARAVVLELTRF